MALRDKIAEFIHRNLNVLAEPSIQEIPEERRFVLQIGWPGNELSLSVTEIKTLPIRNLFASAVDPFTLWNSLELMLVMGEI